jgi:starch synthase
MGNLGAPAQLDNLDYLTASTPLLEHINSNKKKILYVTSEFADLVKIGGLGDVSAALPRAMAAYHDIRVLIPGYPQVLASENPIRIIGRIAGHAALPACRIGRMDLSDGLIVYVILCPALYEREGSPYTDTENRDWPDNPIRFARLALAAAEIAAGNAGMQWCPELVHANDWPSGLTPAYMAWRGLRTPSVFTIHNLAYQGLCDARRSPELGLPEEAMNGARANMEFYGKLSFMKAGLAYASHITTVSQTYAREITTADFGCGLDGLLRCAVAEGRLSGIANGIDDSWDPTSDPHLVEGFSAQHWQGKRANAAYVERIFALQSDPGPLFAVVSRLVEQKGIDLTLEVAEAIVAAGGRLAVIGRGEPELEATLSALARRHPGRIGVHIGFNETDARRMFAASDFLLMPSRFEPCGLSQMYAQRFGSLPIARCTGGLADTIDDGVNGFLFHEASRSSYLQAIERALYVFRHPELLNAMRCQAMATPLYWRQAVQPYDQLYQRLLLPHAHPGVANAQAGVMF